MSLVTRSWIAFCLILATLQLVLLGLLVMQHQAVLSGLVRNRLSVVAQTTGTAFKPMVDLGLPISMTRNGRSIAERALAMDARINAVHVLNMSGVVVFSSAAPHLQTVTEGVLQALQVADGEIWSFETETELISGYTIHSRPGTPVGAVMVTYPKYILAEASGRMVREMLGRAVIICLGAAALAFLLLRVVLGSPERRLAAVERQLVGDAAPQVSGKSARGFFCTEFAQLERSLRAAHAREKEAAAAVAAVAEHRALAPPEELPEEDARMGQRPASLASRVAGRLVPLLAALLCAAAVLLGALMVGPVRRSIEPELAARTNLIGTVVSDNVQRALEAGVPLDGLVGAETYFSAMLENLPEVAYIAIATGGIVLEVGERIDPYLAPPRERRDVRSHPILHDGEEVAYVVIDVDPAVIARSFRNVLLDMGVVILVTIWVSFEIMVLVTSRSLTAPLDRLQRLAARQAVGDFSRSIVVGGRHAIGRLGSMLIERSDALHRDLQVRLAAAEGPVREMLTREAARYGLRVQGPERLRVAYFTDIRLALFLFAAADQLPLAFLPLYTRAAENPLAWLPSDLVVSLPLAAYLLAILLAAPFAARLAARVGARRLMVMAAVPTALAHLGLAFASTVPEIVAWRGLSAAGYALVSLACQDYLLAISDSRSRHRAIAQFSLVLFGGIFAGAALGGVLADRLGQSAVFLVGAALILVATALFQWLVQPPEQHAPPIPSRGGAIRLYRNARLAALVIGIAIPANLMLQAFISYLVALSLDAMGASAADIGRTLMLYFLSVAFMGNAGAKAAEAGVPVALLVIAGQLVAGGAILGAALAPTPAAVAMAVLASGIGHGLVRGAQVALALAIAESELVAVGPAGVLGALRGYERAGSILGLLVAAAIASAYGYAAAAGAVALVSFVGVGVFGISAAQGILREVRAGLDERA